MKPSFKSYVTLLQMTEEQITQLSEEQLDEIFGKFFGKKPEDLKAKQAELLAKQQQLRKERDAKFAAAKARIENPGKKVGKTTIVPSGSTSQAARGRAAELDWVNSMKD
jgi:hypothetical protein